MHLNKDPSRKDLMWFGAGLPVFSALLGYLVHHRTASDSAKTSIWVAGAVVTLAFWAVPRLRRPVFLGFGYLTYPIGWVVTKLLLGAVFLGVVTPTGLLMRLAGKDLLGLKIDRQAPTYWNERQETRPSDDYFRQS
ncbi:MAG TPA: SxtJ family membrane protein [Actinomycetota bacterium]|nr:SxtJ family membrane protein [Actinomycetota bacterium]